MSEYAWLLQHSKGMIRILSMTSPPGGWWCVCVGGVLVCGGGVLVCGGGVVGCGGGVVVCGGVWRWCSGVWRRVEVV